MFKLLLAAALAAGAVNLPVGGLPAGRLGPPLLALKPAGEGTWNVMRGYAQSLGDALPNGQAWSSLDKEQGRVAAAVLLKRLPGTFWADVVALKAPSDERKAEMRAEFLKAHAAAALQAADAAAASVAALELAVKEGRASAEDLFALESQLRGLSVYGGAAAGSYETVRALASRQREAAAAALIAGADSWKKDKDGGELVAGRASDPKPLLSKPASRRLGKAATWAGVGLLGVSAAGFLQPELMQGSEQLPGILTWAGALSFGVGRFFGAPVVRAAGEAKAAALKLPDWISRQLRSFKALIAGAQASADAQIKLEASVGDGAARPFFVWVRAGLRTALYWLPLSLLGMLAGSLLALPFKESVALAAQQPDMSGVAAIPFGVLFNGYAAGLVLSELLLLGAGFRGARAVLSRFLSGSKPSWIAGALALAVSGVLLAFVGYPATLIPAVLGIEAVMIALYARTGSLLAPGLARLGFALAAVEATRMTAYLKVPVAGALAGLPEYTAVGVAVLAGGFFLAKGLKSQWTRLKELGVWWKTPEPGGAPKKMGPMTTAGLLWAVPLFLSMDAVYRLVHWLIPQSEPVPEILHKLLLMPVDIILFNFVIVAALEEWVFRRGVFKPMVDRVKKWGAPSKWWFWPAAILSSLIFSGAHYIDWASLLAQLGIGDPNVGGSLAGAYAFTWASFLARAMGGIVMAGLYAVSGSLLLPMVAHFGSNMIEGLGMRWGFWPFLGMVAAILALQWWRGARVPKPVDHSA
jgi:membrane protease YdiL (CAAX protease family)